jgi:hypothetical protein
MPAPIPVLLMVRELNLGGSERQMAEIAKALDRSRFDPRVGCFRPAGLRADDLRAAGVPIVHFPVPSLASVKGACASPRTSGNKTYGWCTPSTRPRISMECPRRAWQVPR